MTAGSGWEQLRFLCPQRCVCLCAQVENAKFSMFHVKAILISSVG